MLEPNNEGFIVRPVVDSLSDEDVAERVLAGETELFELIMRRYNRRLYRIARSILRNDLEAEDVMQDTYVRAYEHLSQFSHRARFGTWLTQIAVNEALSRLRRRSRILDIDFQKDWGDYAEDLVSREPGPEQKLIDRSVSIMIESGINHLPEIYRTVFTMRAVEFMSTAETAACLGISVEAVKVRLHRARGLLRTYIRDQVGSSVAGVFEFLDPRCNLVVQRVLARIRVLASKT